MSSLLETLSSCCANKQFQAGLIVLGISLFFLWLGFHLKPLFRKIENYPEAVAEVTFLKEHRHKDDDDGSVTYSYSFTATFEVDGQTYSRALTADSEPGKTIPVRYDPEKPDKCYLNSDLPNELGMFIASGIFGVIALVLIFGGIYEIKKQRQAADQSADADRLPLLEQLNQPTIPQP